MSKASDSQLTGQGQMRWPGESSAHREIETEVKGSKRSSLQNSENFNSRCACTHTAGKAKRGREKSRKVATGKLSHCSCLAPGRDPEMMRVSKDTATGPAGFSREAQLCSSGGLLPQAFTLAPLTRVTRTTSLLHSTSPYPCGILAGSESNSPEGPGQSEG